MNRYGAARVRTWQFVLLVDLLVGKVDLWHGGEEHTAERFGYHKGHLISVALARTCHEGTPGKRVPLFHTWRQVDITALRKPLGHKLGWMMILTCVSVNGKEVKHEAGSFGQELSVVELALVCCDMQS